uniref:S1 family peptidase n=1 Tax=Streptomyces sp. SM14 TaxID=1736045 RepID=UPI000CD548E3
MASCGAGPTLPRICDLAGRPRGSGFLADDRGTVVTSHEAVDGLARIVVHTPVGRPQVVTADAVTAIPEWDLALVRTGGLPLAPLLIGSDRATATGSEVLTHLDGWSAATVTGDGPATYTATDRFHPIPAALRLGLPQSAAVRLRLNAEASGSPVLDAETGSVLAVLGTALHADQASGLAVPLRAAAMAEPDGPLGELLRRNGTVVPGFGVDLNLAGALRLTAHTLTAEAAPTGPTGDRTAGAERPEAGDALRAFDASSRTVLALVGPPGTGRSSTLAAHAARRATGPEPAPTVWLRGADLHATDGGIRDALYRAFTEAARVRRATERAHAAGPESEGAPAVDPDVLARVSRMARRPLLIVLDAPEEMPPGLAARLRQWSAATSGWLRAAGARLALACRPEYWEHAGRLFPADTLHAPVTPGRPLGIELPGCHWLGDLPPVQAAGVREALGIGARVDPAERRHPLSLRMLARIRSAQPPGAGGLPDRPQIFGAHLDLAALRVAELLAEQERPARGPGHRRRLAARAAARLHEAARRSLGPVVLPREAFEELFPWRDGWAAAVLEEGILLPAGAGYRFADEEFADWIQGRHLDLDSTLDRLLAPPASSNDAVPAPPPIPRHRIGPVVYALLRLDQDLGAEALRRRLQRLVSALGPQVRQHTPGPDGELPPRPVTVPRQGTGARATAPTARGPRPSEPTTEHGPAVPGGPPTGADPSTLPDDIRWWCGHLLGETLLRLPDATGQLGVARQLADLVGAGTASAAAFPPAFWRGLRLDTAHRLDLLRLVLPADGTGAGDRYLTTAGQLLAADPRAAQPVLCRWFDDVRPLRHHADHSGATVAAAAQALLHTHRHHALDALTDALADAAHPRADELLSELAQDEPSALCRAVRRW